MDEYIIVYFNLSNVMILTTYRMMEGNDSEENCGEDLFFSVPRYLYCCC